MDYFSAAEAMQEIIRMKQCARKTGILLTLLIRTQQQPYTGTLHRVPVWIGYEPLKIKSQLKNKSTVRLIKTSQTYNDLVFNPESVYYSDLWNVESRLVNFK